MNSSLQKGIWGLLIHLVCNVEGVRTETTVLLCWGISVYLMCETTPPCRHWLFSFPSYTIGEDGGKAFCDVTSKLVGELFLWKRGDTDFISAQFRKVSDPQFPLLRTSADTEQKLLFSAFLSLWVCPVLSSYVRCDLGTAVPMGRLWVES